jgi:hypothetical protein
MARRRDYVSGLQPSDFFSTATWGFAPGWYGSGLQPSKANTLCPQRQILFVLNAKYSIPQRQILYSDSSFFLGLRDPSVQLHPMLEQRWPDCQFGQFGQILRHAGAVRAGFEDVQLRRDMRDLQRVVEECCVE